MKKLNHGFTLIELLVSVAIIGIIASIVYPTYVEYVLRAKRADAKAALLKTVLKQEKFRNNNTTFGGTLAAINATGTSPEGYYTIAIDGTPDGTTYTVTATPNFTDNDCAIFVMNQRGKIRSGTVSSKTAADSTCWGK